ncbi:NFYB/HAP3 family transcription factor subunit [Candidatus Pacearchaeota archaeon]|nr:NFYB/HAP3 family transcription factor subunit [Candidatus Pacearchaeota archaeon]
MKKSNKKVNTLIKRKNLIKKLKENGIKRVNPNALVYLEKNLEEKLKNLMLILKDEMTIRGRKTLKKEDISFALEKLKDKKQETNWEI